jgi:hypothetical protein
MSLKRFNVNWVLTLRQCPPAMTRRKVEITRGDLSPAML